MADGILVCGLNGSGKTTLGKALAAKLGFHFIDSGAVLSGRSRLQRRAAARRRRSACSRRSALTAISSSPTCGAITVRRPPHFYRCAVRLDVPREIRMQRHSGARSRKIRAAHAAGRRPVRA